MADAQSRPREGPRRPGPYIGSSSMPPVLCGNGRQYAIASVEGSSSRENEGVLLYDTSQQGLSLGRAIMNYLFKEFAEGTLCTLEKRWSVNFVIM